MKYLLLFLLVIPVSISYLYLTALPMSNDTNVKEFVINQGDGLKTISTRLQNNKLVRSSVTFLVLSYKLGLNNKLQAGTFKLSPSMNAEDIIKKLSSGGSHDYWVKIIEGQRVAEITPKFDDQLEGYIYPDSYLIPQDYTQDQILSVIKNNLDKKYSEASINSNNTMNQSEIITLASIIEREARTLTSKQYVAGILLNRLKINMALQVDASIQYARDTRLKPKVYWTPVTKSDLEINSPYNTYHNPGLTPSPICNPGYDSIYAALHPIASDYLFYITGNDNQMHYAKTLDEHNTNIAKYLK